MNKVTPGSSVSRMIALYGMLPLALILLLLAWKVAGKSREIQARWERVEAVVIKSDQRQTMTLEWPWNGRTKRLEVRRPGGRTTYDEGQKVPYYVNPKNTTEIHMAGFDDLWSGPIVLGVFAGLLTGVAGLLWWLGGSPVFDTPEAFLAQEAHPAESAPSPEDGPGVIEIREPAESWKANVFWGLLFGLLLIVPAYFAEPDTPGWKKYGIMLAGLAWMIFMGRSALKNQGRTIRCDGKSIIISQRFGSRILPLYEVRKVTREDVGKKFREVEEFGMSSREKSRRMYTLPKMVAFTFYNSKDEQVLRLDGNMQPPAEMQRFLRRMEEWTGKPIAEV